MRSDYRCSCGRLLARASGPLDVEIKCPRCGALNRFKTEGPSSPSNPERRRASLEGELRAWRGSM
ncbi:MAG: Com family DNA-binding transcriptional regulator, partial [Rhodospirillales bacterium]